MINRLPNWETALAEYFKRCESAPFVWGERDCSLFGADGVLVMTGVDHGAAFRRKYATARGAKKMLNAHGGVHGIADNALGARVPATLLHRGDLAAVASGYGSDALGIVSLCGLYVTAMREVGTGHVPISEARHGWRV